MVSYNQFKISFELSFVRHMLLPLSITKKNCYMRQGNQFYCYKNNVMIKFYL